MKQTKFRQAIYVSGKFHHWHYWGFIDDSFVGPDTGTCIPNEALKNSQQFTTKRDATNEEIYEGDMMNCNLGSRCINVLIESGCPCHVFPSGQLYRDNIVQAIVVANNVEQPALWEDFEREF